MNFCQFLINNKLQSWQALVCIKKGLKHQQRDEDQVFLRSFANHLYIAGREGALRLIPVEHHKILVKFRMRYYPGRQIVFYCVNKIQTSL